MRSTAHETRVEMTQAFGIPTSDNPRPYGCPECDVAFRKHGHLAKHLRSKSHVTKLEANGLVPQGTYAAFEKCGPEIRERLITTNCELSLQSLRSIAMTLLGHQQPLGHDQDQRQQSMQSHHRHQVPIKQHMISSHQSQMISGPQALPPPPPSTTTTTTTNSHHFQPAMSHLQQQHHHHHLNQQFTVPSSMPLDATITTPPPLMSAPGCVNSLCAHLDPTSTQQQQQQQPTFNMIDPAQQNLPILHRETSSNSGLGNSTGRLQGQASSQHWSQHHLQMDDCFVAPSPPPHSSPPPPPPNSSRVMHLNGHLNGSHHHLQQQYHQPLAPPQAAPPLAPSTGYPLDILSQTQSPISYHQSPPPVMAGPVPPGPTSIYELSAGQHHYQPDMI